MLTNSPYIPLPLPSVPRSGIVAATHLAKLQAATAPVVAIIGDSTSMTQANNLVPTDLPWFHLQRRLRQSYPEKNFKFLDFGIGGQTINSATGVPAPSSWPSFYTNRTATWLSYVQAAAPDTLFFNFGVNSGEGENILDWKTVLSAVCGWSKVPDIILMTNLAPSLGAGVPYSQPTWQFAMLANLQIKRHLALTQGFGVGIANLPPVGLIDIGRYFYMANSDYGYDPAVQILQQGIAAPVSGIATFPYSLPQTDGDFDLTISVPNLGTEMKSSGTIIQVSIGSANGGTGLGANQVNIETTDGTMAYMNYYMVSGISPIVGESGVWSPGTNSFQITSQDEHILLQCNGTVVQDLYVPRYRAPFRPSIDIINPPAGFSLNINSYNLARMKKYQPVLSASDVYGSLGGQYGGDGINHDSSIAQSGIYWPVLEATCF